jgi:flagellar biosynthesis/type III secretory pathway chaperone
MHWQFTADSLREELAEYGALLGLFEQQQQSLFARDPEAVLRLGGKIEDQTRILQTCRLNRERIVSDLALEAGLPANATLRSILPYVEAAARPLLESLIDEINHLLHRVRRSSRQNHALIARTLDMHQELLSQLCPGSFVKTYAANGRTSLAAGNSIPSLQAAG